MSPTWLQVFWRLSNFQKPSTFSFTCMDLKTWCLTFLLVVHYGWFGLVHNICCNVGSASMLSESEDTRVIKNRDILHLPTTLLRFAQFGFCRCKALHFSCFISTYFLLFIMVPSFLIFIAMVLVLSCNSHFIVLCSFFTNTLILPIVNGPTEGLMLIYLCHFFTFFAGIKLIFLKEVLSLFKPSIFRLTRSLWNFWIFFVPLLIHCAYVWGLYLKPYG